MVIAWIDERRSTWHEQIVDLMEQWTPVVDSATMPRVLARTLASARSADFPMPASPHIRSDAP
jgi:hypothetical protein